MLESTQTRQLNTQIAMPGFPQEFSIESERYLSLLKLYTRVHEANRVLDGYRARLRLAENPVVDNHAPLTPLAASTRVPHLYYKREDLTVTKAYKVRGAVVGMHKAMEEEHARQFLVASTGNHALGILKAAELLLPDRVRIAVPRTTSACKLEKLDRAVHALKRNHVHAEVVLVGEHFDDARDWAVLHARKFKACYLDPYANPWVVAGQGTIGLELISQLRTLLNRQHEYREVVVVSPVGGGGLMTGTATAMKMAAAWEPAFRNLPVHFLGLRLADLDSPLGDAIRVAETAPANQQLLDALGVRLEKIKTESMAEGMAFVKDDLGLAVEGASAGTVYPALSDSRYAPNEERLVVSLLSGANVAG